MSKENKVGTNLFGKGQRIISDKYRKGWKNAFCTGENDCQCFDCRFDRAYPSDGENK